MPPFVYSFIVHWWTPRCLHRLAGVNTAAVDIRVQVCLQVPALSSLSSFCICPEVGCLDHKLILYFTFWGTAKLFSIVTALFDIPTSIMRVPSSSHPCQHLFFIKKKTVIPKWYLSMVHCFSGHNLTEAGMYTQSCLTDISSPHHGPSEA